jgi:hypothetical protein
VRTGQRFRDKVQYSGGDSVVGPAFHLSEQTIGRPPLVRLARMNPYLGDQPTWDRTMPAGARSCLQS